MAGEQLFYNRPLPGARVNMSHPLAKGLVGCWLLNENGGMRAMDTSPYGNHGTLGGFPDPPLRSFNGLNFDGSNDQISIPHHNRLDFERTDSFTIEKWLKRNTTGTQEFVLGKDSGWRGYVLSFGADNKLTIEIWSSSGPDVGIRTASSMTFLANVWYCIHVTYDGLSVASGVKAYVHGISEALTASVDTLNATIQNTNPLMLGRSNTGGANFFNGVDGGTKIWHSRILNAEEAKASYISPYHPMGLPLFW